MEPESHLLRRPVSPAARVLGVASIALVAVGAGALAATTLGVPIVGAVAASAVGVLAATGLLLVTGRVWNREGGTDPSVHKVALDQLSEELTSLASPSDVASAIERTIRRLLPCDSIEFSFASATSGGPAPSHQGSNHSGEHEIITLARGKGDSHELAFPVEFHGVRLGRLKVSRAANGARFSAAESELLRAIAHESGLALAHAVAYSELEKRRKQQAAAWRDEREALVETLSAEIAHEVRYPINFFRTIFQRASGYRVLEEEDIEIGCEEVDRLERLVSGLRRMATQHLERRAVDVAELCGRAEVLLRDRMGGHPLILDIEEGGAINCDIDKITQVLVNLLANALEATEGKGGVGIEWRIAQRGGELSVWDTGPGFSGDPSRLFAPWYTTKPRGTGLGLAITYRLVRAHGWSIEAMRRDAKTLFVVAVPPNDILLQADRSSGTLPARKGEVA